MAQFVIFDPTGPTDPAIIKTVSPLTYAAIYSQQKVYTSNAPGSQSQIDSALINSTYGKSTFVGPRPPKP